VAAATTTASVLIDLLRMSCLLGEVRFARSCITAEPPATWKDPWTFAGATEENDAMRAENL